jgi:hypothetical protein
MNIPEQFAAETTGSSGEPTARIARASVRPLQTLDLLSQREMASLANADATINELFRRCALAILNTDGGTSTMRARSTRPIRTLISEVVPEPRGLKLELVNAPVAGLCGRTHDRGYPQPPVFCAA